jgi:hypothetical protein
VELSRTIEIVNEILTNPSFGEQVKAHFGWPVDMSPDRAALLFLTLRFQWAVEGLSLRTVTLKREVDGANTRVQDLEDRITPLLVAE